MNFGSKHVQQPQKQLRRVCARVSGLVGTRRGGTLVMTENLCVRLSGGVHIGVPSTLRSEIDKRSDIVPIYSDLLR